jgi:hypothetical protein
LRRGDGASDRLDRNVVLTAAEISKHIACTSYVWLAKNLSWLGSHLFASVGPASQSSVSPKSPMTLGRLRRATVSRDWWRQTRPCAIAAQSTPSRQAAKRSPLEPELDRGIDIPESTMAVGEGGSFGRLSDGPAIRRWLRPPFAIA